MSAAYRPILGWLMWTSLVGFWPGRAEPQPVGQAVREAYLRTVAEFFRLPLEEVVLIADGGLPPDEVPVLLFLAQRAGVSPDALAGLRGGGRSWMDVAARYGLGAQIFHVALPEDQPMGLLGRAMALYRTTPARDWPGLRLEDEEIVGLVNLRVLSQQVQVAPLQVLRCRESAGSFVACYPRLRRETALRRHHPPAALTGLSNGWIGVERVSKATVGSDAPEATEAGSSPPREL